MQSKTRIAGSGFTTMTWRGTRLAYLQTLQDTPPQPVAGAQVVQAIDDEVPQEIVTAAAVGAGTLRLTFYELWNVPVWASLPGLEGTNNLLEVLKRQISIGEVTCRKLIKSPLGITRARVYHSCFGGDTRFLTKDGGKSFNEAVDTDQLVLGYDGEWTPAEIRSFGDQRIFRLTLSRYGRTKEVLTTAGHRWFKSGRRRMGRSIDGWNTEVVTEGLRPGDCLKTVFSTNHLQRVRMSAVGIQAGIVFGDGTLEGRRVRSGTVKLYGEKDAQLLKWFPLSPTRSSVKDTECEWIQVCDLPQYFKSAPPLGESKSYLYGWLAGYFAADGNVTEDGAAVLSSSSLEDIRVAQDVCHIIGVRSYGITKENRTVSLPQGNAADGKPGVLYRLRINARDVGADFFLISEHRERAESRIARPEKTTSDWMVVSVEDTGTTEEVFCAVVPHGKAFVLEDNILTGNCVLTDVDEGEQVNIGTMTLPKTLTLQYVRTTIV